MHRIDAQSDCDARFWCVTSIFRLAAGGSSGGLQPQVGCCALNAPDVGRCARLMGRGGEVMSSRVHGDTSPAGSRACVKGTPARARLENHE